MLIYETILTDVIQQIAVLKENRTTQLKPKIQQSAQQESKSLGKFEENYLLYNVNIIHKNNFTH